MILLPLTTVLAVMGFTLWMVAALRACGAMLGLMLLER